MIPIGGGILLLGFGVLMIIFGGSFKTSSRTSDEVFTSWKEWIDKWESLNNALSIVSSKEVEKVDPRTLALVVQQFNTLSRTIEDLRTATSSDGFCRNIEAKLPSYSCKRVNDLLKSIEGKISNAWKIVNKEIDGKDSSSSIGEEDNAKQETLEVDAA